jgi:hypothetical protein
VSILEAGRDFEGLECYRTRTGPVHYWVTRPLPAKKSTKVGREVLGRSFKQFFGSGVKLGVLERILRAMPLRIRDDDGFLDCFGAGGLCFGPVLGGLSQGAGTTSWLALLD